jgi:peroxiredoxin
MRLQLVRLASTGLARSAAALILAALLGFGTVAQAGWKDWFSAQEKGEAQKVKFDSLKKSFGALSKIDDYKDRRPPELAIENWWNSDPLTLEQLKGKVVGLYFLAVYCKDCIKALKPLEQLWQTYKDKGFVLIAIFPSLDEKKGIENIITTHSLTFPVAQDRKVDDRSKTVKAYGVASVPSLWYIGKDGNVRVDTPLDTLIDESCTP